MGDPAIVENREIVDLTVNQEGQVWSNSAPVSCRIVQEIVVPESLTLRRIREVTPGLRVFL